jgi:hypothetical protein
MFLTIRNSADRLRSLEPRLQESEPIDIKATNEIIGWNSLDSAFSFSTCKQFFNIFNKNDPVAYRIEPMTDASLQFKDPVLVPHFDGGLRTQYMIKSVFTSAVDTFKVLSSPSEWGSFFKSSKLFNAEQVIDKGDQPKELPQADLQHYQKESANQRRQKICPTFEIPHVNINGGRRFDYLVQESALEVANEYISSLTSHTCYFEQKDVARFIAAIIM